MSRREIVTKLIPALLVCACCGSPPPAVLEPPPPGLSAAPRWLAFTCSAEACATRLTTRIAVVGTRSIAVKRIALSDRARDDFEVVPDRAPPFVLDPKETLEVAVAPRPNADPGAPEIALRIAYGDASASESDPNRVPSAALDIPLVRRVIGEARLAAAPELLDFGAVLPGEAKTLPLVLAAAGFGNARISIASITSDARSVSVPDAPRALAAGETLEVPVVYAPEEESAVEGRLEILEAHDARPIAVRFRGTSIRSPRLSALPSAGLDFGDVPVTSVAKRDLTLKNLGTQPLVIRAVGALDVSPTVELSFSSTAVPVGATPAATGTSTLAVLPPLGSTHLEVVLRATTSGPISGTVRIESNDPSAPALELPVHGLVTEPKLRVDPLGLDFGVVPRGWSESRTIELSNAGFGTLVIDRLEMALGSSALFSLRSANRLPVHLEHDQRIGVEIELRAEAEAELRGTIAVESNDPAIPFFPIPLRARGASCDEGCPITHGSPSCASGVCAIGACDAGWFDLDQAAANGCECNDPVGEPGGFCSEGHDAGTLEDDGASASITGVLPTAEDVDVVRFYAHDSGLDVFSDDYDVRVRLESSDPSIQLCVYRHEADGPSSECALEEEACPSDLQYHHGGGILSDQGANYVVRIFRAPGAAASCARYTLYLSNGR